MAFWTTAGADMAPHVYQELLKCEKVMTFKLLGVDPARVLSKVERSRTLNVQELLLSWGLGTNQREQKLLDARALPWLPKMLGLNIDPCTKRPSKDALAQKFGPTDRRYLYLRSRESRLWSKLHLARAAASDAPHDDELPRHSASAHVAYERARQEKDAKLSLVMNAGKQNQLLDRQPAAASPAASPIIKRFKIVVVQRAQKFIAYELAAMVVDEEREMGLTLFGEWVSVQDKLPVVYSELDARERSKEAIEVNRRAVRARDGGMRVPLLNLSITSDNVVMVVPAPRQLIKAWCTWGQPIPTVWACTLPDDEVYVKLGITATERDEMIIKVNGSKRGRFAVLEYATKRRGDYSKARTWPEVIPDKVMPKWTCDLLLDMVLSGWGE